MSEQRGPLAASSLDTPVLPLPNDWPVMSIAEAHARLTAPGARFEIEEVLIDGRPTLWWKNCPLTLRDVFQQGRSHGSRIFLVHEDERATFDSFSRAVLTLAHELQRQGVVKGDRVAIAMRNLPEWPVAFFAAAICGAIVTPLNAWWTGAELQYGLANSEAKVAVVDAERFARLVEYLNDCPALERIYVSRSAAEYSGPRVRSLEVVVGVVNDWIELPELPLPDVSIGPEDDATIFYTSGTTGKPRGALGTHRNMAANVFTAGAAATRLFLRRGAVPPDPATAPQRVTLLSIPLFHVTGCGASLVVSVFSGSKLVMMRKWDVKDALPLIERERVTLTGGVPSIAWQLVEHPDRTHYDLSSLDTIAYGGAPSAPDLVRRIKEVFPQAQPGNGWGMTETSASFSSIGAEDYIHRPASCGPAPAVGAIRIMDTDGKHEIPPGQTGELWVKGPMVVKSYWKDSEATAKTFVNGWLRTGDIARVDDAGFCYIVDRAKDMLIRGGENIYCVEIENVLYDHPEIIDAAIVGIPHKVLGEEPCAVVQLTRGAALTADEVRAHVASRLAAFKVPVRIAFLSEPLPRNAAGKVMKKDLRQLFAGANQGSNE